MQTKNISNKISKKPLKRLISDMSLIKFKEFPKSRNKFSMFVTCKNKMEDVWLQCSSYSLFLDYVFLFSVSLKLIQRGKNKF